MALFRFQIASAGLLPSNSFPITSKLVFKMRYELQRCNKHVLSGVFIFHYLFIYFITSVFGPLSARPGGLNTHARAPPLLPPHRPARGGRSRLRCSVGRATVSVMFITFKGSKCFLPVQLRRRTLSASDLSPF